MYSSICVMLSHHCGVDLCLAMFFLFRVYSCSGFFRFVFGTNAAINGGKIIILMKGLLDDDGLVFFPFLSSRFALHYVICLWLLIYNASRVRSSHFSFTLSSEFRKKAKRSKKGRKSFLKTILWLFMLKAH